MTVKKSFGIMLILSGVALFYSAFTATATGMLGEWMIRSVPDLTERYTPRELLMAWGGLLAGFGGVLGFRKT